VRAFAVLLLASGCSGCLQRGERARMHDAASATVLVWASVAGARAQGSGAVILDDGTHALVLTCAHVVHEAQEVVVSPAEGADRPGRVVRADALDDLALVEVDATFGLGSVPVSPRAPVLYTRLLVSGAPNTSRGTIFLTLLTSYDYPFRQRPHWMLTGGIFYPGISGGPVLDEGLRLVALVSNVDRDPDADVLIEGTGYAITLDTIHDFLKGAI